MTSADELTQAAETLERLADAATPGPWRDSSVNGNRYGALVADAPHPDRKTPDKGGWGWDESYGGCLIGESLMPGDRALIATLGPDVARAVAAWLRKQALSYRASEAQYERHAWGPPIEANYTDALKVARLVNGRQSGLADILAGPPSPWCDEPKAWLARLEGQPCEAVWGGEET